MKIYQAACDMLVQDSFKYTDASCHCFRTVLMEFNEVPGRKHSLVSAQYLKTSFLFSTLQT